MISLPIIFLLICIATGTFRTIAMFKRYFNNEDYIVKVEESWVPLSIFLTLVWVAAYGYLIWLIQFAG